LSASDLERINRVLSETEVAGARYVAATMRFVNA
jgi:hypothetical protein